jgi:hypothetical protein
MATKARYVMPGLATPEHLVAIHDRAKMAWAGFLGFLPTNKQHGAFKYRDGLPELSTLAGLVVTDVESTGYLKTTVEPWADFREVADTGGVISELGRLTFTCGFQAKGSHQDKRGYDTVSVVLSGRRLFFVVNPNGSFATTSAENARSYVTAVVSAVGLPLRLVDVSGHFRLEHVAGGEVNVLSGFGINDVNPSGFRCEVHGSSPEREFERMRRYLELFATERRFEYSWQAGIDKFGRLIELPEVSHQVYADVVDARFPAERYELAATFRIASIEGLGPLREMCGPRGRVTTRLCSFDLPDDNWGELAVETTSAGHSVELTLRMPDGLHDVEEALGIRFGLDKS